MALERSLSETKNVRTSLSKRSKTDAGGISDANNTAQKEQGELGAAENIFAIVPAFLPGEVQRNVQSEGRNQLFSIFI